MAKTPQRIAQDIQAMASMYAAPAGEEGPLPVDQKPKPFLSFGTHICRCPHTGAWLLGCVWAHRRGASQETHFSLN
jgi:hypothetical protein